MPTYEYECKACGLRFDRRQAITERALVECPECHGEVRRLIGPGAGLIVKGGDRGSAGDAGACSLERGGRTCCGRDERCGKPPCEERPQRR